MQLIEVNIVEITKFIIIFEIISGSITNSFGAFHKLERTIIQEERLILVSASL
jgi:hypothetical protein